MHKKTVVILLLFGLIFGSNPAFAQSTCNLAAIRAAFTGAGCVELANCQDACSLYFILPVQMSGNSAQAFAQNLGANLISVESLAENTCIVNNLNSLGYGGVIWIGFNDIAQEGNFVWFDQAPVIYTHWAGGEPNNSGNEDCTQIYPNGFWNDLSCGSANSKSVIEVNLCPQITVTPNPASATVCRGQGVTLSAVTILGSPAYTYSWGPATGLSTTAGSSVVASPQITSNYTVTVTDRYGCTATNTKTVNINVATANAGADQTTCLGTPVTFMGSGGVTYSWTPATGLNSAAIMNPTATPAYTTPYTLTVTDANGCTGTDNILVNVNPLPPANAGPDAPICVGTPTNLNATGGVSYSWFPASGLSNTAIANPVANPATTTTYTVTVTDANTCVNTDAVLVTVNPYPRPMQG